MELLLLEPVFKQMIWGGSRLKDDFGYDIPGDNTGECTETVPLRIPNIRERH